MHLSTYLGQLEVGETCLAASYRAVAEGHAAEADIKTLATLLAGQSESHVEALAPIVGRYGERRETEPHRLAVERARPGALGLLRDLQDLYLLATDVEVGWSLVGQAAKALRDEELIAVVDTSANETETQRQWLSTRIKTSAPQALLIAE